MLRDVKPQRAFRFLFGDVGTFPLQQIAARDEALAPRFDQSRRPSNRLDAAETPASKMSERPTSRLARPRRAHIAATTRCAADASKSSRAGSTAASPARARPPASKPKPGRATPANRRQQQQQAWRNDAAPQVVENLPPRHQAQRIAAASHPRSARRETTSAATANRRAPNDADAAHTRDTAPESRRSARHR